MVCERAWSGALWVVPVVLPSRWIFKHKPSWMNLICCKNTSPSARLPFAGMEKRMIYCRQPATTVCNLCIKLPCFGSSVQIEISNVYTASSSTVLSWPRSFLRLQRAYRRATGKRTATVALPWATGVPLINKWLVILNLFIYTIVKEKTRGMKS